MQVNRPFLLVPAVVALASVAFRIGATSMRRPGETNSKGGDRTSNHVVEVARATSTPTGHKQYLRTNTGFKMLQASTRPHSRSQARCHRSPPSIRATL